jgi:hypothetical protein
MCSCFLKSNLQHYYKYTMKENVVVVALGGPRRHGFLKMLMRKLEQVDSLQNRIRIISASCFVGWKFFQSFCLHCSLFLQSE